MPIGSASAWRSLASASGSGAAEGGGPGGTRVRSAGKRAGILSVPQLTMNSCVCAIRISPLVAGVLAGLGRSFARRRAGFSLGVLVASAWKRAERQLRQTQQPIIVGPGQRPHYLEPFEAVEKLLEHHTDFEQREVRSQPEMGAEAKADVQVRVAPDVEAKRIFEC